MVQGRTTREHRLEQIVQRQVWRLNRRVEARGVGLMKRAAKGLREMDNMQHAFV